MNINAQLIKKNEALSFHLPQELECAKPTEERGLERDEARLMVSEISTDKVDHTVFNQIGNFLSKGDVLAVNTSGTLKAAIETKANSWKKIRVHLSTKISNTQWVVELREIIGNKTQRIIGQPFISQLELIGGGSIHLIRPYYQKRSTEDHIQLWIAEFNLPNSLADYLDKYGKPIKYNYVDKVYPQSYYQTVFAKEMGSAEMPSAGRAFTKNLVDSIKNKGIQIVPILLHTGVASLEMDERPYEEYYKVSKESAQLLNRARQNGRRIIAVGTTVVRALETVTDRQGTSHRGEGWTDIFITPQRGIYAVDGLLTGFHEPKASHLHMLEALAGKKHLGYTYQEAIKNNYLWHEFGDLHLILP